MEVRKNDCVMDCLLNNGERIPDYQDAHCRSYQSRTTNFHAYCRHGPECHFAGQQNST